MEDRTKSFRVKELYVQARIQLFSEAREKENFERKLFVDIKACTHKN